MLRLTLDMDDVLADTHEKLADIVLTEFDTTLNKEDFKVKPLRELLHPKQITRLRRIMNEPGFFAEIPVKKDAREVVYKLSGFYEIFIATAAMEFPNSFKDKFDWLHKHFDFIPWSNIVFCGHKSIIHSDYLIDDTVRNLDAFKGEGILFTATHNLHDKTYRRVSDWKEVAELFLPNK